MKKQLRKAMICTVAMMLVAVLTLTGVTYAWFSVSDAASVTDMSIQVESRDGGVYISTKPYEDFGTSISFDVKKDANGMSINKFDPVSTSGRLDGNGKLVFFTGSLTSPTDAMLDIDEVKATDQEAAEGMFLVQDVYFDNSTGSGLLVVSLKDTIIESTNSNKKIQAATRIAVVTHGSWTLEQFEANKDLNTPYPAGTPTVQILETNPKDHTTAGGNEYKVLTGKTTVDLEKPFDYYYGVNCVPNEINTAPENQAPVMVEPKMNRYNKKVNEADKLPTGTVGSNTNAEVLTKLEYMKEEDRDKTKPVLLQSMSELEIMVPAGSYLWTTVYVWIEGQDPDCQNNISGTPYKVSMTFTKARVEQHVTCTDANCKHNYYPSEGAWVVLNEGDQSKTKVCPSCKKVAVPAASAE